MGRSGLSGLEWVEWVEWVGVGWSGWSELEWAVARILIYRSGGGPESTSFVFLGL